MRPLVSDPKPDGAKPSGPATNVTVGPTDALSKGYTIEGIVWNEVQPLALVNEQVVSVGERLTDGALITEITPDTLRPPVVDGLPRIEFFQVKTKAGDLDAYMIKPVNFDSTKKYPLLIKTYAGPESRSGSVPVGGV